MSDFTQTELSSSTNETIDEFLNKNLSEKKREVIKVIQDYYDQDFVSVYKAAQYALLKKDLPARLMIASHCMRELLNSLSRYNENELKEQIVDKLRTMPFLQNCDVKEDELKNISNPLLDQIKNIVNAKRKLKYLIKEHHPFMEAKNLNKLQGETFVAKEKTDDFRHFNSKLKSDSDDNFNSYFERFDDFILALKIPFAEKKEEIDRIINETPSADLVKRLEKITTGELAVYLFSKIKDPEWLPFFKNRNFIKSTVYEQGNNHKFERCEATVYLKKIAPQKPNEVSEIIRNLIPTMGRFDERLFNDVMTIFNAIPESCSNEIISVSDKILEWLQNNGQFSQWILEEHLLNLIKKTQKAESSQKAMKFVKYFFKLKSNEENSIHNIKSYIGFDDYLYKELLEKSTPLFLHELCFVRARLLRSLGKTLTKQNKCV